MNASAAYRSRLALLRDILTALLRRALAPFRIAWRRTWPYRLSLRGRLPDRIVFHPHDPDPRRLEDADALLRGRFRFAGETVDLKTGSVFDAPAPSRAWAEALHGFAWLAPLSTASGDRACALARGLIAQWLARNGRYSEPAWSAHVLGRRLTNVLAHGRFALTGSDVLWRSKLFVSLRDQSQMLARIAKEAPEGLPRMEAAAAVALSGACLNDSSLRLAPGLEGLETEIGRQILPDSGHASRSPEALLRAYRLLTMVGDALAAADRPAPETLRSARERMAPMLRFFRLGDGGLAIFNGGRECDSQAIESLLARDDVRGQPSASAPYSGYRRLTAGRSLAIMDCGRAPDGAFSIAAHAACLAFEFSAGKQRVVVNCGATSDEQKWGGALRATAAHSTVTVAGRSMGTILDGRLADILGPRLIDGSGAIATGPRETANGWSVEASHDGYMQPFGLVHERRLTLASTGGMLSGEDRLLRKVARSRHDATPFAARFHIHPDIRVSHNQGGGALLKLPSGEGWSFRANGGELSIEESVYLGGGDARRSSQLVVRGAIGDAPAELAWAFERLGSY